MKITLQEGLESYDGRVLFMVVGSTHFYLCVRRKLA